VILISVSHDKDFIWKTRGYANIFEMNKDLIDKWNSVVTSEDVVYHLGDVMLGNLEDGIKCLHQLNGNIHIIRGNHCTDKRVTEFLKSYNVLDVTYADVFKANKHWVFYLSHYPSLVANEGDRKKIFNLSGHIHTTDKFLLAKHQIYNVGVDAHNGFPVSIDEIIEDIRERRRQIG